MNWTPWRRKAADNSVSLTTQQLVERLSRGSIANSGVSVTPGTAMTSATVFAIVRVIAESIGQLPAHLMREQNGRRQKATDHPLFDLFHGKGPNDFQTPQEFFEWIGACLALRGNAYAFKNVVGGRVVELLPLAPAAVRPVVLEDGWTLAYDVTFKSGAKRLPASAIFHVPLFSLDGFAGVSPVHWARETIGLDLASREHGARLFANGAQPHGLFTTEKKLSPEASKRLIAEVEELIGGLENVGRNLVLGEGMKYQQIGMSSEDAEWLEGRKFTRDELCGIWRVPPHKIANLERSTNNNIEHQGLEFTTDCLGPYLTRIESRVAKQLLTPEERKTMYLKFNVAALLRGDHAARANYYKAALGTASSPGWLTPNGVLEMEDMDPSDDPGADMLMTVLRYTGQKPDPGAAGDSGTSSVTGAAAPA